MNYILDILSLIGIVGLFLFSMKLMSESLQKIAGNGMRNIIKYIASSRFKAVMSGIILTALIQASAVVTVMTVSFVNAGMLSLTESIGIIMGANIGTTIKGWLISMVGLNTDMGVIALPILGLTFPFLFSKSNTKRNWSGFAVGLALLFISLDFLKMFFVGMKENTAIFEFLSGLTSYGTGSILIFVFVGLIISALVQSSSAAFAVTIVLCSEGWIPFELGAAMILGENIGTTITANIAAIVANAKAKRAALSHTLFNVIGVIWAVIIFHWLLKGIEWATIEIQGTSPYENNNAIPVAFTVLHSAFNIINTILLVGFIPGLVKLTEWIIPVRKTEDETTKLKYIQSQFSSSEMQFMEAKKEIASFARRGKKLFALLPSLILEKDEKEYEKIFQKIKEQEDMMDKMEDEINDYLNIIYSGELSEKGLKKVKSMQRIAKELESIGDTVYHMAKSINRKNKEKVWFNQYQRDNIKNMYDLLFKACDVMIENLDSDYDSVAIDKAQMLELQINKLRKDLLKENFEKIDEEYNTKSTVVYFDLIGSSEKMADHIFNINQAIAGLK
ncbi:MAG TPA: Na/Pi cotransporter family protein [Bacteroidales bacterium]|nr:Na/Pi cotransporter family protein [Bacteroidales bacterium]HPS16004.1 Na/Pi cotransporter family protein [Bacteroidales bacterium]